MPPLPKHPSTRQRRNKGAGARHLNPVHDVATPELPEGDWHPLTLAWWGDVWASPMAPEFEGSDRHGLFMLATLVNEFWLKPCVRLAAEIRQHRQCFGLTPIDRRRLQWEIDRGEEAEVKTRKRRAPKPEVETEDPRRLLA